MKITYIHHSSFLVELDTCTLLFDYYKGTLPHIRKDVPFYVFVSHAHHDHFSNSIFAFRAVYANVRYVLSNDIHTQKATDITFIGANEDIKLDGMMIQTLRSTDEGVAFLLDVDGTCMYHAGDLNWWHWEGENTDLENEEAKQAFMHEMVNLKNRKIDLAFVPLDPRQEDAYALGFDTFMRTAKVQAVFPMHFWLDYTIIDKLCAAPCSKPYRERIYCIRSENEVFHIA